VGNNDLRFMNDQGMARRGFKVEFTNVFKDKHEIKESQKGVYAKKDLRTLLDDNDYKNAFIHLLLEYTKIYYDTRFKTMSLKVVEEYKDICDNNDPMAEFIDNFIIKAPGQRIGKDDFTEMYNNRHNTKIPFNMLLSGIKRLGIVYDRNVRCKGLKGALMNVTWREVENNNDDEYEVAPKRLTIQEQFKENVLAQQDDDDVQPEIPEESEESEEEKPKKKEKKVKKIRKVPKGKAAGIDFETIFD